MSIRFSIFDERGDEYFAVVPVGPAGRLRTEARERALEALGDGHGARRRAWGSAGVKQAIAYIPQWQAEAWLWLEPCTVEASRWEAEIWEPFDTVIVDYVTVH